MAWYSGATAKPLAHNYMASRMVHPIQGLVLHITDAEEELKDLFNWFNTPHRGLSAHFGVSKDGEIWQFLDTDHVAFAVDGRWGGAGVDNHG